MKSKSKRVFLVAVSLLLVVALGIPLVTASLTQASYPLTLLDSVDIGNPTSESGHNLQDWTNIWSSCGWCGPDGNMRLIWGGGGYTCAPGDNWASVDLNAGAGCAKTLKAQHLDGAADDGFNVYVNGTYVGTYVDQYGSNTWTATEFDISSGSYTGLLTIKFEATADAWGGCPTYGQVAFNMIELWGAYAVTIDIKPGSDPNSINLKEQGVLPVAVLGSSVDVSAIDLVKPITLGGTAVTSRGSAKAPKLAVSFEDVDGDGSMDLVAFFRVQDLVDSGALDVTTTELMLEAETTDGVPISGIDTVNVVPDST